MERKPVHDFLLRIIWRWQGNMSQDKDIDCLPGCLTHILFCAWCLTAAGCGPCGRPLYIQHTHVCGRPLTLPSRTLQLSVRHGYFIQRYKLITN